MKKSMFIGTLFLFLAITIQSNAEVKITPTTVTTPDDSAALRLSGIFATRGTSPSPYGAVISGVNSHSSYYFSCGGYFSALGTIGVGVYGNASNTGNATNYGGYFAASGTTGVGVYGSASGTDGVGVRGNASKTGGYFTSSAADGATGVRGDATGTYSNGVFGYATGGYGYGVRGNASNSFGTGVYGKGEGLGSTGVYGEGATYDFYAGGLNINYYPFTGAHEVKFSESMPEETVEGLIVSVTGNVQVRKDKNGKTSLSSTLPTVTLSTKTNDRAVFGVVVSEGPLPRDHWYEAKEGERFGGVNALGEGRVWVTDINGRIQAGDYITTSEIQGYGQMQDDDIMHSYTLGKAIETIDWEQVTETVKYCGKLYKKYLIAVVYTSG